ncbi:hypothetical protein L207DRAFT_623475, partial [Hyaloscypha variabilis F]
THQNHSSALNPRRRPARRHHLHHHRHRRRQHRNCVDCLTSPWGLKGKLWAGSSTVDPATIIKLAAMVKEGGGDFLAMPVFGAAAMAIAGQLVYVPVGPKRCIDRIRPFLNGVMGASTIDISDQAYEKTNQLKCIGNMFLLGMVETLSEACVVAEKCEVGNEALHKFVTSIFPEGPYVLHSRRMLSSGWHRQKEPLFDIALARKDARHASLNKMVAR